MKLFDIGNHPTTIDSVHESVFRSYHILETIDELLAQDTPAPVTLSILRELRNLPRREARIVDGRLITSQMPAAGGE